MGMHYKSPPLPVSLAIVKSDPEMPLGEDSLYSEIVSANALFERLHSNDAAKYRGSGRHGLQMAS